MRGGLMADIDQGGGLQKEIEKDIEKGLRFIARLEGEPVDRFWINVLANSSRRIEEYREEETSLASQFRTFRCD
jgi:hypothetical protein